MIVHAANADEIRRAARLQKILWCDRRRAKVGPFTHKLLGGTPVELQLIRRAEVELLEGVVFFAVVVSAVIVSAVVSAVVIVAFVIGGSLAL